MFKIPKQEFTAEFKELAVKRVKSGQSVGMVARELGLVEQTLQELGQGSRSRAAEPAGRQDHHAGADGTVASAGRECQAQDGV